MTPTGDQFWRRFPDAGKDITVVFLYALYLMSFVLSFILIFPLRSLREIIRFLKSLPLLRNDGLVNRFWALGVFFKMSA